MKTLLFTTLALVISSFFLAPAVLAQSLPCGNIIGPSSVFDEGPNITKPIEDCADPFKVTTDPTNSYNILIDGTAYNKNGDIVPVAEGGTNRIHVEGNPIQSDFTWSLYKHEGNDYQYVDIKEKFPTSEYFISYVETYFTNEADRALYLNIVELNQNGEDISAYLYNEDGSDKIDVTTGETVNTRLQGFYLSADYDFPQNPLRVGSGDYTMVITEFSVYLINNSIWDKIRQFIMPTAYAQEYFPANFTYTITFTVVEEGAEPVGASSVLFLPGIQASRLYTKEQGSENRLWEPNINADVEKLALDENGVSVNQIYTQDVVDEIFSVSNVYRTFINQMNDLKNNEKIIKDVSIFAYDWRFSVEDIVADGVQYENEIKNLVAEVESLASSSFTDKVTIVAHSNGGLVGKSLISELERLGKAALVDKLVMVGTPQLGTPKAIGVLLHGLEQQVAGGLIVDDVTAREVIKNMPGAYSLLPSAQYFEKSSGPMVVADNSNSTAAIRTYGPIESASGLKNFLLDTSNTREGSPSRINQPSVLNPVLFAKHEQLQSRLDNWRAPAGVAVYEVVGTGISTIRGIEYREFPCVAVICAFGFQMKPYPLFGDEGDETVMALSAGGYDGEKVTAKVDLEAEGDGILNKEYQHSNLTESPTVQDFIDAVIRFPYVSETMVVPPDFVEVSRKYTVIGAHSPVVLSVEDAEGRKVGRVGNVVNEDIPGSQFIELGGSSYILVPADSNYTVSIEGTDIGVYSLTIDSLEGDSQTNEFLYVGASTSPTMKATFTASSSGFSTIKTDSNGDGQIDLEQNLNGEIVVPDTVYTYSDLHNAVNNLQIPRLAKQVLLLQVTLAERLSILASRQPRHRPLELKILKGIEDTIKIMEKKKIVASVDATRLYVIINYLKQ